MEFALVQAVLRELQEQVEPQVPQERAEAQVVRVHQVLVEVREAQVVLVHQEQVVLQGHQGFLA